MSLPQIDLKVIGDQLNHIHVDKGPYVLASCIAVAVLPAIAVALRFWARKIGKSEWRADDHFIVVALILSFGLLAELILTVHYGVGQMAIKVGLYRIMKMLQVIYAYQITYSCAITSTKMSILLFYHRTFVSPTFRRVNFAVGVFILVYFTSFTLVSIFQCRPIRFAWQKTIEGTCINYYPFYKATAGVNLATDILLLLMPLYVTWRLRVTFEQKVALTGIFLLGSFVCVVGGLRIPYILLIKEGWDNPTYTIYKGLVWTNVETCMAIVCACLPVMRPLVRSFITDRLPGVKRSQGSSNQSSAWRATPSPLSFGQLDYPSSTGLPDLKGTSGSSNSRDSIDYAMNSFRVRDDVEWSSHEAS